MVMFKIMVFFTMLFGFFFVSWLWHRTWFGLEENRPNRRQTAGMTGESGNEQDGAPLVLTTVKSILAALVGVVLIGLYLSTYWLLT